MRTSIPTKVIPLKINAEAECQHLEQVARNGLEPQIELQFKIVPVGQDGVVLIIRIPRSDNLPHRIIRKIDGRPSNLFWARSSAGRKYEPNVEELRQLFIVGAKRSVEVVQREFDNASSMRANPVIYEFLAKELESGNDIYLSDTSKQMLTRHVRGMDILIPVMVLTAQADITLSPLETKDIERLPGVESDPYLKKRSLLADRLLLQNNRCYAMRNIFTESSRSIIHGSITD